MGIGIHNKKDGVATKLPTRVVISSPQKVEKRGLGVGRIQNGHCQHLGPNFRQHHKGSKLCVFIFIFKQ